MTKTFFTQLFCLLAIVCLPLQASKVASLDVKVVLKPNGDALITENWDIEIEDDAKTEWYVAHYGLGERKVTDLTVYGYVSGKGEGQKFETMKEWDLNKSREEKNGKCGILPKEGGAEICFGFGDFGRHKYTIVYTLTSLVQKYDSHDGFNHCFVDMNVDVENVKVTVTGDPSVNITSGNTKMWAFGYDGDILWKDSNVEATADNGLDGEKDKIIVMLQFDKGVFSPSVSNSAKWDDVKALAFEDSDYIYKEKGFLEKTFGFIPEWLLYILGLFLLAPMLILAFFTLRILWWVLTFEPLRVFLLRKKLGIAPGYYYRDIDPNWVIVFNASILQKTDYRPTVKAIYGSNNEILSAHFVRMISNGCMEIIDGELKGKVQKLMKIGTFSFNSSLGSSDDESLEREIFSILEEAAGDDRLLQPSEFRRWALSHTSRMKKLDESLKAKGDKLYNQKSAANLYGLKNFLNDFTNMNERGIIDTSLWGEYLVYASLFGIADRLASEMKMINPEFFEQSNFAACVSPENTHFLRKCTRVIGKESSSASTRSSGGGGRSSRGGGGGYSGGGGGGGR